MANTCATWGVEGKATDGAGVVVFDAIAGVSPAEAVERLLRVPGFRAEVYAAGDPIELGSTPSNGPYGSR